MSIDVDATYRDGALYPASPLNAHDFRRYELEGIHIVTRTHCWPAPALEFRPELRPT